MTESPAPIVILTGSRGFIGSHLVRALEAEGLHVLLVKSDLTDANAVAAELAQLRRANARLLHLATINRVNCLSEADAERNVRMVENLCRFTDANENARGLFFSTTDVFGAPETLPLSECSPFKPLDHYGKSKHVAELALGRRSQWSIMRLPGIYGPRLEDQSLISRLRRKLLAGEIVRLSRNGDALRDFVHLDDLLHLITAWIKEDIRGTWNVATGVSYSMATIVGMLSRDLRQPRIILDPNPTLRDFDLVFNTSKLSAAFPTVQLSPVDKRLREFIPIPDRTA